MRVVDIACLALAIVGAAYVYGVKHESEVAHENRRQLERDIAALSQDVSLLEADLAALEQPSRLVFITDTVENMGPLTPIAAGHYVSIEDIPFRSDLQAAAVDLDDAALTDGADIENHNRSTDQALADDPIDRLLEGIWDSAEPSVGSVGSAPVDEPVNNADLIGALLDVVAPEERP